MLITTLRQVHCSLDNFSGPLECLYQLVQKREIDICEVALRLVAAQFTHDAEGGAKLEQGAEFVGTLAALLLLKSRTLLPRAPLEEEFEDLEEALGFGIIHQLVEYCHIKELAVKLQEREAGRVGSYARGLITFQEEPKQARSGVEHLSIEQLAEIFGRVAMRSPEPKKAIKEEIYKVSDKLRDLRGRLRLQNRIELDELFGACVVRDELIVTFLAILELMKCSELQILRELSSGLIWLEPQTEES